MRTLDAGAVAALGIRGAVRALEAALQAGLDPEAEAPRTVLDVGAGQLLVMPSASAGAAAVKLVTVGPADPRVQGVCVVFDPETLAPAALVDGPALTTLRTPAVSALAVDRLARPDAARLLVYGRGPQAHAHVEAVRSVRPSVERVDVAGREGADPAVLRAADLICCCTTAREPLFDGAEVRDDACVVAIGSHEPEAREVDAALVRRATVVVESRASALAEAGDVIQAGVDAEDLVPLAALVRGEAAPEPGRPRLFKSTGMAWEDAVVAAAALGAAG
jgi:ornithine cyclodeaminase